MSDARVLGERYEVRELIGRGGMADVHLGLDLRLGRPVAIKILRQDLARDPLFQSRFRREAQAVAGLNDPTIVAVYDTGEDLVAGAPTELRVPFIVMEFVAGRTLRDLVKQDDLTPEDGVRHLAGVLSALRYSHRAGIVHRDIKPANVMITPEGTVKVMDFGIARAMADSQATMTQTHAVLGTAQYLSPEQARGEQVDARSDLYSAGCLLFELLTGRPPFVGDSPVSVAYQHVREEPPTASSLNPEISEALDSVLAKALQKDREDRFQDAASFRTALLDAGRGIALVEDTPTEALGAATAQTHVDGPTSPGPQQATAGHSAAPVDDGDLVQQEPRKDARERHRRSSRTAWMTVFLVVMLFVLGGGAVFLTGLAGDAASETPEVPTEVSAVPVEIADLRGMTALDASNALRAMGLVPSTTETHHATMDEGLVIDSDPSVGSTVAEDSTVRLSVSLGPAVVQIPDGLTGMTEAGAREALEDLGLRAGRITSTTSADGAAGTVLSTDPGSGQSVPEGGAVDLVLSNGEVTVPLLIDLTVEQAAARLADPAVGLTYTVRYVPNSVVQPGIVTGQSHSARSDVAQGTQIVLSVAAPPVVEPPADPDPAPEPSPEPSPDPEPSPGPSQDPGASQQPGPGPSRPTAPGPGEGPGNGSEGRPTVGPEDQR